RGDAGADDEPRPIAVEDVVEGLPRSVGRNASRKRRLRLEPIEDRWMTILTGAVVANPRIRLTCKHFVITWIGNVQSIRDAHRTAEESVAEDRSAVGDRRPEEWHE